jgi:hypothetical protein
MAVWMRNLLVVFILLGASGGQWVVLQSVAWAGMIVSNLRHDSLSTAVSHTFDGQHPCPLCKAIQSSRQSEKKSDVEIKITRLEFPPMDGYGRIDCENPFCCAAESSDEFSDSLASPPPLPPPRLITA